MSLADTSDKNTLHVLTNWTRVKQENEAQIPTQGLPDNILPELINLEPSVPVVRKKKVTARKKTRPLSSTPAVQARRRSRNEDQLGPAFLMSPINHPHSRHDAGIKGETSEVETCSDTMSMDSLDYYSCITQGSTPARESPFSSPRLEYPLDQYFHGQPQPVKKEPLHLVNLCSSPSDQSDHVSSYDTEIDRRQVRQNTSLPHTPQQIQVTPHKHHIQYHIWSLFIFVGFAILIR